MPRVQTVADLLTFLQALPRESLVVSEAEEVSGLSPLYVRFDPGKWPEPGAVVLTNFDPEIEFAHRT